MRHASKNVNGVCVSSIISQPYQPMNSTTALVLMELYAKKLIDFYFPPFQFLVKFLSNTITDDIVTP